MNNALHESICNTYILEMSRLNHTVSRILLLTALFICIRKAEKQLVRTTFVLLVLNCKATFVGAPEPPRYVHCYHSRG